MEILPFFQYFKEFYRIFRENWPNNLEKHGHIICRRFWGRSPPNLENLKNRTRKSNGNRQFFEKIHEF